MAARGIVPAVRIAAIIIKRDTDHLVIVKKDWVVGTFLHAALGRPVPDYRCSDFEIKSGVLTVFATGNRATVIDGATLAPDWFLIDIAAGYIPHDLGYNEIDNMSAAPAWVEAGWTRSSIRKLWDIVLGSCLMSEANRAHRKLARSAERMVALGYYCGVRVFGGIALACITRRGFTKIDIGSPALKVPYGFAPSGYPPSYSTVHRGSRRA